jgi:hypothetical protein
MHRHSIDLGGLLFGMAFAIAGISFLLYETTDTAIDPAWVSGLGLMLLGTVALVVTLARATHRDRGEPMLHETPDSPDSDAPSDK